MANLRALPSRKRRRASTIIDLDVDLPGFEVVDEGLNMLEAFPSEFWSRSRSRSQGSSRSAWTPRATTGTETGTSALPSEPPSDPERSASACMFTPEPQPNQPRTKFIIGVDYGTTFSSVSYVKLDPTDTLHTLRGEQIMSVIDWPDTPARMLPEVPSEGWYLNESYYWGYGARQAIVGIEENNLNYKNRIIQYAKLLLPGNQRENRGPREELRRTLFRARKDETQANQDYLRQLFKHTKHFLETKAGLNEECEVELVFCVPAGWPAKAIRTLQEIIIDLAQEQKLGILAAPFVLNEPEAAAAYILESCAESKSLSTGEVFIVCDDAITYMVDQEQPFRVNEVVTPTGSNCGSGYANQALKEEVIRRIKSTAYESLKGPSFEYIIEHDLMSKFEYDIKRKFDPANGLDGRESIVMHGLKPNKSLGFGNSTLYIERRDIADLFEPCLKGIIKLIRQQINAAKARNLTVQTILLVGGFSEAPILRYRIEEEFNDLKIVYPPAHIDKFVIVSHGAVFRAFNKADGPKRIVQSNFGFLQFELYSNKEHAHLRESRRLNHQDGKYYVRVLDWVIKKNSILSKQQQFRTCNWQTFKLDEELMIYQQIWVSDFDNARDHYQSHDPCNRGAEILGTFQIDLEPIKNEGLLKLKSGPIGKFYEIHYELCMEVNGRNLSVKLFCPPGERCRAQTQICIAAAFIPGTD
ncbi:Hsp70 family protein [Aspergillus stella-maris]|uniref:Hsp70 family protein n=1 Tax=Aspergillus stella-maris TaxID=1810926 RepID=UPI003CCDBBBC